MIFFNCFGGLLRADKIVATLENAIRYGNITKPLIMRLKGNRVVEAMEMGSEWKNPVNKFGKKFAEYEIYWESDFDKAAKKAVKLAAEKEHVERTKNE